MTIEELKNEIEEMLQKYENDFPKFHNVENISRADLESTEVLLEALEKEGNLQNYIVTGNEKKILDNCCINY